MIELMEHQLDAIDRLSNGSVLYGAVGIGKSATILGYYERNESPRDIYVITTAKKRDSRDWEREAAHFGIGPEPGLSLHGSLVVDSWNNIGKYVDVRDAFFVFDEQRVVGKGTWVRNFIKIARKNHWVLLSATPGDNWMDYAPVFVANGFFKNRTQFNQEHVIWKPYVHYPVIEGYRNERKLELLRNHVLVEMSYLRESKQHLNFLPVGHDAEALKRLVKERWHSEEDRPIKDAAELWRLMRRVVNSDPSRLDTIVELMKAHPRLIIFYNFNYELEILRGLKGVTTVGEWNGHRKDPLPSCPNWVYLVQYISGSEGWNCIETNAMVLYSLTYSYKNYEQARGRIDRLDTPFQDLFYYILVSNSGVDRAIRNSLLQKHSFNERKFLESPEALEMVMS